MPFSGFCSFHRNANKIGLVKAETLIKLDQLRRTTDPLEKKILKTCLKIEFLKYLDIINEELEHFENFINSRCGGSPSQESINMTLQDIDRAKVKYKEIEAMMNTIDFIAS
jgi:hypothetical protein